MSSSSAPNARSLFAAAREDGPDSEERDAVFRKIALATGVAATTAVAATALATMSSSTVVTTAAVAAEVAASAGAGAGAAAGTTVTGGALGMKLLALGAALGAASTALGVFVAVTVVMPEAPRSPMRSATSVATAEKHAGATLAQPSPRKRDPNDAAGTAQAKARADVDADANANGNANGNANANANANGNANANANGGGNAGGDLLEEARLITAARSALVSGDAARALALVQSARKLNVRALEPEELGLESRALRALGRADEAAAVDLTLRRRYPDHALAR